MKLSSIKPNPQNPRNISPDKLEKLGKSIKDFSKMMAIRPIVIDKDNIIIGGNQRYYALKKAAIKEIPDDWVKKADDLTDDERRRFIVEDNVGFGEWDFDALSVDYEIPELEEWGLDLPTMEDYQTPDEVVNHAKLCDKYIIPPFTILDTRQGYWQERKRAWLALGIDSELGRGGGLGAIPTNIDVKQPVGGGQPA